MSQPYFSIIIPSYNRGLVLSENLRLLLKQTFANYEVIIVDDGSTDDTEHLITSIADKRVKYFRTRNQERACARNFGLKHARGLYINFFDSDDQMYPDRLNLMWQWLTANNEPLVAYTHYDFCTPQGQKLGCTQRSYKTFTTDILFNNFLATGAVFLKKSVAVKYKFNETASLITAEDWELWLRIHTVHQFHEYPIKTFAIVEHPQRSLNIIPREKVLRRELCLINIVTSQREFEYKYGKELKLFIADRYTFISLTMIVEGQIIDAQKFLLLAIKASKKVFLRKRFWAIAKKLFIKA